MNTIGTKKGRSTCSYSSKTAHCYSDITDQTLPFRFSHHTPCMENELVDQTATAVLRVSTPLLVISQHVSSMSAKLNSLLEKIRCKVFSAYQKLLTIVFVLNSILIGIIIAISVHRIRRGYLGAAYPLSNFAINAASFNILIAITIRNEHIINMLYRIFVPNDAFSLPLWFRRPIAKVHCYGGVYSGTGVSASLWYFIYAVVR
jgi:hypothetical protein